MSFFLRFNRKSGKSDDALYAQVWREIESKNVDEGLWAKFWAANKGDEEKTKTAYLNERVKQLQEEAKAEETALPVSSPSTGLPSPPSSPSPTAGASASNDVQAYEKYKQQAPQYGARAFTNHLRLFEEKP